MLSKYKYKMVLEIAPVRITWRQELVEDEDAGNFYVKLIPQVEWNEGLIEQGGTDWTGIRVRHGKYVAGSVQLNKQSLGQLGAMKRSQTAREGQRIYKELIADMNKDLQKKLKIEANKRRGQRWNKKV